MSFAVNTESQNVINEIIIDLIENIFNNVYFKHFTQSWKGKK